MKLARLVCENVCTKCGTHKMLIVVEYSGAHIVAAKL